MGSCPDTDIDPVSLYDQVFVHEGTLRFLQ